MDTQNTERAPDAEPAKNRKIEVIYRAGEGDPVSTTWRGRTFIKDKPVELDEGVDHEADIIEAARSNPSFDVDGESKAEQRDKLVERQRREQAEGELAALDHQAEELEQRQTTEMNEVEARHQRERDDFMARNEQTRIELLRTIRGSDGSDDLHPADGDPHGDGLGSADAAPPNTPYPQNCISQTDAPRSNGGEGVQVSPAKPGEQPTDPAAPAPAANQASEPVPQTAAPAV